MTIDGLITVRSSFGHAETLARFEAAVRANGLRIVADVDHAIAALEAGVSLEPTTVLMVGDGACQAVLMKSLRSIAFELPFKVLVWQEAGETWLSYNDCQWLAKRHGAGPEEERLFKNLAVRRDGIARKARTLP